MAASEVATAGHAFTRDAAAALGGPAWLARRRDEAAGRLAAVSWPTPREEIWRYSRVDRFDPARYRPVAGPGDGPGGAVPAPRAPGGGPFAAEAGERAGLLVVRNGRVVRAELDDGLAARGVVVADLAEAAPALVEGRIGSCSDASPDPFTVLHDAFLAGGALILVPDGVVVEAPIVVLHWSEGDGVASFPHTFVGAGAGSEVAVVERYASTDQEMLVDSVVELDLAENAHVRYLAVQEHGRATWQVALQRAHLARDSTLRSSAVALGGDYARLRSESLLSGEGAESDLLAVYYGDGEQMLDFRTLQDHAAPHTRSDLLFKGAVEDRARSVYSGLIRVRPDAQKVDAHQSNRNLVLSEGAGAESIPNLVIEADDVRCTHASAVGPIDDDALYYLATRGVPPGDAERLIVLGFFEDVFSRLPLPSLEAPLRRSVNEKVGHLQAPDVGPAEGSPRGRAR